MSESRTHIQLPTEGKCAFCEYLAGARPYTVLCRSDLVAVLVTREQRGIGHLLVLPTRHYPTLLESSPEERHALIDALERAATAIDVAFERPGISIWQNNGVPAHQEIPHMHFHVAGTLPGGGTNFDTVPELTVAETDSIARKIREAGGTAIC